jgi:membrane associated rhomboid family serine protease
MGIYDREYYRGETRGPGLFSTAPVCKAIIVINVGVFLLDQLMLGESSRFDEWFAATSQGILRQGRIWELLTATFLHADPFHLVGNMLFFWVVGREMEAMYGQRDFLALYLSAGVFSTLVWAIADSFSPAESRHVMIGASGAVLAVVVLYALYYPRRELLFMFVIPIEMWLLVVLFLAYQVFLFLRGGDIQVAVESHLAGAAYGYLFKRFDLRWSQLPFIRARRPRFRVIPAEPREKPLPRTSTSGPTWAANSASVSKPASTAVLPEEQLDARLDEVLAKIAREGRAGLSDEENRVLQEASRRARNRRSDRL